MEDSNHKLESELLKYRTWVGNELQDVRQDIRHTQGRIENLESSYIHQRESLDRMDRKLEKAEEQREKFNTFMAEEVRTIKKEVGSLTESDNERHTELVGYITKLSEHVGKLAEQTSANSNYISEAEAKERQEKYAKEKVEEALAPRKAIINKVKMTAAAIITTAVLGVLGKLGWMAINLDELVVKAKQEQLHEYEEHELTEARKNNGN